MATETESKKRRPVTPNIPSDLHHDILIKLPVKSLLRFKAVCKVWHSTIEDPTFADHHFHRNKGTEIGLATFSSWTHNISFSSYDSANFYSLVNGDSIQILDDDYDDVPKCFASCNGLLCFIRDSSSGLSMYVCNPATERIIKLPPPKYLGKECRKVGIGYDSCMKKFKVVLWETWDDSKAVILTLGPENSWRKIRGPSSATLRVNEHNVVYMNGATYWHSPHKVISFRYTDEEFELIPSPIRNMYFYDYDYSIQLCEVGDRLCLMQQRKRESPVQMWFLKTFGEHEWIRQEISLPFGKVIPIRKGEIIVDNRWKKDGAYLCNYNEEGVVTTTNRVDNIMRSTTSKCYFCHVFHMGSLVSLNTLVSSKFFIKNKKSEKKIKKSSA